jgi:hypothetical protein
MDGFMNKVRPLSAPQSTLVNAAPAHDFTGSFSHTVQLGGNNLSAASCRSHAQNNEKVAYCRAER